MLGRDDISVRRRALSAQEKNGGLEKKRETTRPKCHSAIRIQCSRVVRLPPRELFGARSRLEIPVDQMLLGVVLASPPDSDEPDAASPPRHVSDR